MGMAAIAIFLMGGTPGTAQEPDENAHPKPAARTYSPAIYADDITQPPSDALQPDMRPLLGVQYATLGTVESRHSYWMPGFQYGNTIQSQPFSQSNSSGWYVNNYFSGNVSLLESWSRSQLALNFSGGGSYSTNSAQGASFFSQLGVTQSFQWERWQLLFLDQFSYLPESQFGFGGGTSLGIPGVGGSLVPPQPGLSVGYMPNQSIFSSTGPRSSNSFTTQAVYALSPRGSLIMAGSYGILQFTDPGNIDSNDFIANVGYNYTLTRKNTLGLAYLYTRYTYSGNSQVIGDNVVHVAFGRSLTGRLAWQIYGGPNFTTFAVPIGGSTSRVSGSGGATLTYQLSKSTASLNYNHGLSGGSGVFTGANTDQVQGSWSRQLTRAWQGQANFGFSRNQNLVNSQSVIGQAYDSWYFGGGLSRPLGQTASFAVSYSGRTQNSALPACVSGNCSTHYFQNQILMSFQWHTRPFVLH